jgi:hypothetical protein
MKIQQLIKSMLLLVAFTFLSGCASHYIKLEDSDFVGKPISVNNSVPFVEQTSTLCGPTALYMAAKNLKPAITLDEVTKLTLSPGASGTYKQDMLAATRRLGLAPYQVNGLSGIFSSLAAGTPVIIFHETDFFTKHFWHYSVLTGYDRPKQKFYLHIGKSPYYAMDMSELDRSWKKGESWAYIVMMPNQLPPLASVDETRDNALAFLRLGFTLDAEALAIEMEKRWPDRYEADVILAEVYSLKNKGKIAISYLRAASKKEPGNLALKKKIHEINHANL